jgi:adenylate cyclase
MFRSFLYCLLAEVGQEAEQIKERLLALNDGIAYVERTGERFCEAEIHRLRGGGESLLKAKGGTMKRESSPEACFLEAIEVACHQVAKPWELRATTGLARLWQTQGRIDAARHVLAEIYGWFTEGFNTPDLREAKALLEELA